MSGIVIALCVVVVGQLVALVIVFDRLASHHRAMMQLHEMDGDFIKLHEEVMKELETMDRENAKRPRAMRWQGGPK